MAEVQFGHISSGLLGNKVNNDIAIVSQSERNGFTIGHRHEKFLSDKLTGGSPGLTYDHITQPECCDRLVRIEVDRELVVPRKLSYGKAVIGYVRVDCQRSRIAGSPPI